MTCKPSLGYQTLGVVVLASCRLFVSCRGHRQEYAPLGLSLFSEESTSARRALLQLEQMLVQVSGPMLQCKRLLYVREICVPLLSDFSLTLGSKKSACRNRLLGEFRMRRFFDLNAG